MVNRKMIKGAIVAGAIIGASLTLTGCSVTSLIEEYLPEAQNEVCVYGPAPEETNSSGDEEGTDGNESDQDVYDGELEPNEAEGN